MYEPTLFDQVVSINRNISKNSVESFRSKEVQKKRLTQKDKILIACRELGMANDRMMSELSGVPINLTPDRRAQLVGEKKLTFSCKRIDPVTKKLTDFYEELK